MGLRQSNHAGWLQFLKPCKGNPTFSVQTLYFPVQKLYYWSLFFKRIRQFWRLKNPDSQLEIFLDPKTITAGAGGRGAERYYLYQETQRNPKPHTLTAETRCVRGGADDVRGAERALCDLTANKTINPNRRGGARQKAR